MKANFALSLSFDGIRLLHRAAGGWRHVGEVDIASDTLTQDMAILRKTALELDPSGLASKLILPPGQIRYMTLKTGDVSEIDRRIAARKALDGATPYAVEDLAFDISEDGAQTHIAAVAHETLEEAESFAVDHGFAPLSWVAMPGDATFLGEPFFGATRFSEGFLSEGGTVEKDGVAVVVLETIALPDTPAPDAEPATSIEAGSKDAETDPQAQQEATKEAAPIAATPDLATAQVDAITPAKADEMPAPTAPIAFRHAAQREATPTTALKTSVSTPAAPASPPVPAPAPAAAVPSFSSRRNRSGAPSLGGARRTDISPSAIKETVQPKAEAPVIAEPVTEPASPLPSLRERLRRPPAPEKPQPALPNATTAPVPEPETEKARMTVFGARSEAAPRRKPRFLGLILSLILLAVLAMVGIWAALFLDDSTAGLLAPENSTPPRIETAALDPELAPEPEPVPDPEPPAALVIPQAPIIEDLLATEPVPDTPATAAAPEPAPAAEPTPDFTLDNPEEFYAVSGIWTIPPAKPETPALIALNDVYQTAIDPTDLGFDALALLPETSFDTDAALASPSAPPPPNARFELDARGLVTPSPEGTLNPDGVLVFAGKPPVLPPRVPDRSARVAPSPKIDTALAAFRPRARPGNLVENTERQQLGGLSRSELASFRPRLRPRGLRPPVETPRETETNDEAAAEAEAPPTAQAVAKSFRPETRPRNFARIVARSQRAPQNTTRAVAQVAPRVVKPARPSAGSVTRQATVKNQLNLNKINLIGVYGSPSSRRALVRLANGRFKKVKVGDRIDGGRVSAIGNAQLSYRKGSRNVVLKMPKT